jgi:hypothetical protein
MSAYRRGDPDGKGLHWVVCRCSHPTDDGPLYGPEPGPYGAHGRESATEEVRLLAEPGSSF